MAYLKNVSKFTDKGLELWERAIRNEKARRMFRGRKPYYDSSMEWD